jgi:hypothetical protein
VLGIYFLSNECENGDNLSQRFIERLIWKKDAAMLHQQQKAAGSPVLSNA